MYAGRNWGTYEKGQNCELRMTTHIPNSETKRPARMSQLCQGSCEPCHTFPVATHPRQSGHFAEIE